MVNYFSGTHDHKLDDKGRVALPPDFRKVLTARGSGGALMLLPQLNHAKAHTVVTVETHGQMVKRHATTKYAGPAAKRLAALKLMGKARPVQLDSNGRILLSEGMRQDIDLAKEVRFLGNGAGFEIWAPQNLTTYEAELEAEAEESVEIDVWELD